ncbi:MnuA family membrane nuclease [Mycoplasmopsis gallinacea]|uniref:Membrane nuclease MnuA n=1 Tax=Mycoplasmopsis gallinacea TaxID=29556 RepID=A0A449A3M8_9BACT|nr:hypothetical protein [Mycoplasmopsis gallinacea]VEU58828.1 Membrane nuclease MnuA [Mycoplasmopsis gallinacea]
MKKKRMKKAPIISSVASVAIAAIAIGGYFVYDKFFKTEQTTTNKNISLNKEGFNITHWNILNYGGKNSNKGSLKVTGITEILANLDSSIIGLTEINHGAGDKVANIVERLNKLQSKHNYASIIQNENDAVNPDFENSREQIAVLYDQNVFKPINFNGLTQNQMSFKQPIKFVGADKNTTYTRFPMINYFENKVNGAKVATIFAHFDSPDSNSKNGESDVKLPDNYQGVNISKSGQGSQEVSEAFGLAQVFEFVKKYVDPETTIIFGGDTNIKPNNNAIFQHFEDINKYQTYYNSVDLEIYETSLGSSSSNPYANPYDKFLFIEGKKLDVIDANENPSQQYKELFKYDIVNMFNKYSEKYDRLKYRQLFKKENSTASDSDFNIVRKISDHAPITMTVVYKK